MEQYGILFYLHLLACGITIYVLFIGIRQQISRSQSDFVLLMLSVVTLCLSGFLQSTASSEDSYLIMAKMNYFAKIISLTCLPKFVGSYCNANERKVLAKIRNLISAIMIGIVFTFDKHTFFFKSYQVIQKNSSNIFVTEKGIVYHFFYVYAMVVMLYVIVVMIIQSKKRKDEDEKKRQRIVIAASVLPAISTIMIAIPGLGDYDLLPFSLAVSSMLLSITIQKYYMFDLMQNAKEYVLSHIREAIIVVDDDDEVLYFNHVAMKLAPTLKLYQKLDEEIWNRFHSPEGLFQMNGRQYRTGITDILRIDGSKEGRLLEAQDNTEYEMMLQEKNRLMNEANEANEAKNSFLASMSHDIRTPINVILGMNEMILREVKTREIEEYARSIENASHSLLTTINDILDFSKIETGKLEIVSERYSIGEVVSATCELLYPRLEKKNLQFLMEVSDDVPNKLFGDKNRIQQVVANILTNAVKYTEKGFVKFQVTASQIYQGIGNVKKVDLTFRVEDSGIGIRQEDIPKIFQSFQRVDEEKNRNIEGTGLGLVITKKLLEQMNGTISVESQYQVGSVFTVVLPQIVMDASPYKDEKKKNRGKGRRYEVSFIAPLARVLVVDDNAVNLKVFSSLLKQTKMTIDQCHSGQECLELVQVNRYDMIFMDHMMPGLDGIETLKQLKKMPDHKSKDAVVIALTANAISGAREMYLREGFKGYLTKPIDTHDLENVLIRHLPKDIVTLKKRGEAK